MHDYVALSGNPLQIFLKIDMGYHRAGLSSESKEFQDLVTKAIALEDSGAVQLIGFYCHAGHSYGDDSETASLKLLIAEIESLEQAAARALKSRGREPTTKLILSVGATPTATSIQALIHPASMQSAETGAVTAQLEALISRVKETYTLEVHAGVYPFLDMQQLATRSSSSPSSKSISTSDIAITILTEVCSLYPHREPPEALIAAGSLALGREPCKSYPGWGVVSDWGFPSSSETFHQNRSGWQVGRISQEHGILTADPMAFDGDGGTPMNLKYGQKVRCVVSFPRVRALQMLFRRTKAALSRVKLPGCWKTCSGTENTMWNQCLGSIQTETLSVQSRIYRDLILCCETLTDPWTTTSGYGQITRASLVLCLVFISWWTAD